MKGRYILSTMMTGCAVSIVAPSSVHAQPERATFVMESSKQAKAREQNGRMADCLRKRMPTQVEELLEYNLPQASRLAAMLYSAGGQKCVSIAAGFKADELIGSLFRSAYLERADVQPLAASDLANLAASYPSGDNKAKSVEYLLVSDCVVSRNAVGSRALLASAPGKSAERASIEALQSDAAVCASVHELREIDETLFITALAQVLYRRSRGESFDPNSAPSNANNTQVRCESERPDVCVVQPNGGSR